MKEISNQLIEGLFLKPTIFSVIIVIAIIIILIKIIKIIKMKKDSKWAFLILKFLILC